MRLSEEIITRLVVHSHTEQEYMTDLNFSVLNRAQIYLAIFRAVAVSYRWERQSWRGLSWRKHGGARMKVSDVCLFFINY